MGLVERFADGVSQRARDALDRLGSGAKTASERGVLLVERRDLAAQRRSRQLAIGIAVSEAFIAGQKSLAVTSPLVRSEIEEIARLSARIEAIDGQLDRLREGQGGPRDERSSTGTDLDGDSISTVTGEDRLTEEDG